MSDVPPMSEAVLDDAAVDALFRDVRELTDLDEVILKHGPGHIDDQKSVTLEEAKSMLAERRVRGVQIRYRHDGAHWWDTLMPVAEGIRLVRVRHDF